MLFACYIETRCESYILSKWRQATDNMGPGVDADPSESGGYRPHDEGGEGDYGRSSLNNQTTRSHASVI